MMAGNDKQQSNIEQARELLSPYLDGQVSGEERELIEEALAVSDELRADLDTLRQTVSLLQALPPVPAPRPFTLSEADVGLRAPAAGGRRFFGLPTWLAGLAAAAAALVCVLAVGGLFLAGQPGGLSAPAELARLNEDAASQAVQTEAEPVEEAAEAPAAEAEIAPQEAVPAEPSAPAPEEKLAGEEAAVEAAEPEVSREEAQAVEAELMEEAEEPAADEAVEESMPAVEEAAQAEQEQAETESELYREDEAGADAAAGAAALPTPTPAPLSTLEQPALAEEVRPSDDQRDEPAAEEESLAAAPAPTAEVRGDSLAEGAPPPAPAEATEAKNLAQEDIAPRLVEIRDQSLSIRPGLIRLEGVIEVEPETVLQATLLRNGAPLESWAASPVVQTVVQAGGQFAFEFEAATGGAEQDLFAVEPANYQIVISSVGVDEPVTATVFFDTFGPAPAATAEPPTATSSPPATPTAVAKVELTSEPSPSPSPVVTPMEVPVLTTPTVAPTQTGPIRSLTLIVLAVLLGFGALVVVGLLLWWLLKKQPR